VPSRGVSGESPSPSESMSWSLGGDAGTVASCVGDPTLGPDSDKRFGISADLVPDSVANVAVSCVKVVDVALGSYTLC